jgi:hypothetical protein
MKKRLKFLGILLALASCKTETEQRIVGKWQATQLMECDNLVPIQTELVDIEFTGNGNYVFHSTLNIKEEGTYRLKKNYLFTQDKLSDKAPEKAVLIKELNQDSMILQMSYKGKDQFLTLKRERSIPKNKEQEDAKAKAIAMAAGTATAAAAVATALSSTPSDSIQKAEAAKKAEEEKKKQAEADKAAERKKEEAAADKKREEAKSKSKKSESSSSSSEAYKKREAKRKEEEKKAKAVAEKKAEAFRKEYKKREAEKKKNKK